MSRKIPILETVQENKDENWGSFLNPRLTALCQKAGIPMEKGYLTRKSGEPGIINPVRFKKIERWMRKMTVDPSTGMKKMVLRPIMPAGRILPDTFGPENQKPKVIQARKKLRLEHELFNMLEKYWLQRRPLLFSAGSSKIIQINNQFTRISPYLHHLKYNCQENNITLTQPSRKSWRLPCVVNYRKVIMGDSQVLRLSIQEPDVLTCGYSGADCGDMIHLLSAVKVRRIDDPDRHQAALSCVPMNTRFVRLETNYWHGPTRVLDETSHPFRRCQTCRTQCWEKLEELVFWLGHNQYLKALPSPKIHPPQLPRLITPRSYG